jgi:O-antigen/teichoic acid export membrane protein
VIRGSAGGKARISTRDGAAPSAFWLAAKGKYRVALHHSSTLAALKAFHAMDEDAPPMTAPATSADSGTFGAQIMRAVAWRSGSQIIAQMIMWAGTFFVIRILDPRDYGLFAMTQSVLVFLSLLNGQEFAGSLVQAPVVTKRQIAQVFGLLIVLNGLIAIAQLLLAPLAAEYFHHPLVATMLRVQALLYLSTPLIAIPGALLSRDLNYHIQAKVNLGSALIGAGVSLGMALAGFGVWTLVIAPICCFWTRAIGLTIAARMLVLPSFDLRGAGHMIRYGGAMLASSCFWLFQTQADVLIGGRSVDAHHLGLYAESLFLAQIVTTKFVPPLNDVAFSAYSRLQHDRAAAARAFEKSVRLILIAALPFYAGLAVTAEPFVSVVLGDKWLEMAPIVRLLALAMPFVTVQILFTPATTALGHARVQVWSAAAGAVIMPIAFFLGVRFGIIGLAWSWVIGFPLLTIVTATMAMPIIGTSAARLWRAAMPSLLASIGMAAMVIVIDGFVHDWPALPRLALLVSSGVAAYGVLTMLVARDVLAEMVGLLKLRMARG